MQPEGGMGNALVTTRDEAFHAIAEDGNDLIGKRMKNNEDPKYLTSLLTGVSDYLLWLVLSTAQVNVSTHILTSLINMLGACVFSKHRSCIDSV